MPELPEVETIRRQLEQKIAGKTIKNVEVLTPRLIKVPLKNFERATLGATITGVKRRAKLLIINLLNGYSLLIHLKMTGQLIYQESGDKNWELGKHTHIIYTFNDNTRLLHNDMRKFGFVKIIRTNEIPKYLTEEKYGPEPLEKKFTKNVFKEILAKYPKKKIKQLLMDQKIIAGIGNIYADEICFYAKVRPVRITESLKARDISLLFKGIKKILAEAIKYRGSSSDQYVDTEGKEGKFVPRLKVYGREKEKCFRCGGKVEKIKVGGRGTHFCPKCQK